MAATWNSDFAKDAARQISSISSLYCGPASVGWIAAVWNQSKGRSYEFKNRIKDKKLFSDGPRLFNGLIPGFQSSLDDVLKRETNGELKLSNEIYFRADNIHRILTDSQLPFIIRLVGTNLKNGLHYIVAYRSESVSIKGSPMIVFHRQDNGLFSKDNSGLSTMTVAKSHMFLWGAKRVAENQ